LTVYALLWNAVGQVWDATGSAWVAYATVDRDDYDLPMTETGAASRHYVADMPAAVAASEHGAPYLVAVYSQADGSPDEADLLVGAGSIDWKLSESGVVLADSPDHGGATAEITLNTCGALAAILEVARKANQAMTFGAVADVAPTAESFDTDLTVTAADFYANAAIVFRTGALAGESREIVGSGGVDATITVAEAFNSAPADGDEFVILGFVK
jgi:hypothetical protein